VTKSHGSWTIQHHTTGRTTHDPWRTPFPWSMDRTIVLGAYPVPMTHGSYDGTHSYLVPMTHGSYDGCWTYLVPMGHGSYDGWWTCPVPMIVILLIATPKEKVLMDYISRSCDFLKRKILCSAQAIYNQFLVISFFSSFLFW
jgi:hypothetical protein